MNYNDRSGVLYEEIKKAHAKYRLNKDTIKIYHMGRNNGGLFQANKYEWDKNEWKNIELMTECTVSTQIFVDGSGAGDYKRRFLDFKGENNENTSRNFFHCFCDTVKDAQDIHTGGVPQIVGLYNGKKFNGMYHGIIRNGVRYFQALEVESYYEMNDIRWYNENFEICDWKTMTRKEGAMVQPISKRQLPDSSV